MVHALSIVSSMAIGAAGCFALASLSRDLRALFSIAPAIIAEWRAIQDYAA